MPVVPDDIGKAAHDIAANMGFWSSEKDIRRALYRAIKAERRRCVEAVKAELIVEEGESYVGLDGFDVDYDRGVYAALRAIQGHQA